MNKKQIGLSGSIFGRTIIQSQIRSHVVPMYPDDSKKDVKAKEALQPLKENSKAKKTEPDKLEPACVSNGQNNSKR